MEEFGNGKEEVYTKAVRAGKRTYFMDVKETKSGERYLTITESKRHFDEGLAKFVYEKHKIFLYKEDFEKFQRGLGQAIHFVETGECPEPEAEEIEGEDRKDSYAGMDFDNLDSLK